MSPVVDRPRAMTGPSGVDIRSASLTIVTRRWTSGAVGVEPDDPSAASFVDVRRESPAAYEVRRVTTREITSSSGRYEPGSVRVGPITPAYEKGDGSQSAARPKGADSNALWVASDAQLRPSGDSATEVVYVLSGAHEGEYALVAIESTVPFGWWLVLSRRESTH
jgi:hypothetical protein